MQRINAMVFDSSSEAILITDIHARIVCINAAFTQVSGYAPHDIIGHNLLELFTPEGAAVFSEHVLERQLAE